jgi:type III pantothenate kinase
VEGVLILCDIGNTHFHFNINEKLIDTHICKLKNQKIYYISVNEDKKKELIQKNPDSIDLSNIVDFNTTYLGVGIDRIMACKTIETGVVIDAGSAITIDLMNNKVHLGGYILPGLNALNKSYSLISEKLDYNFNMQIKRDILPINTVDAISFGAIGMVINFIENVAKDKKLYFTGGDGLYLSKFFDNSIYIKDLVFRGMLQTIKENNL